MSNDHDTMLSRSCCVQIWYGEPKLLDALSFGLPAEHVI